MVSNFEIDMSATDIRAAVRQMIAASGLRSLSDIARQLGVNENTLRTSLHTGRIRVADFLRIAELCGFQVIVRNGKGEA